MKAQADHRSGLSRLLRLAVLGLACALAAVSGVGGAQSPETGRWVEFEVADEPSTITGFRVGYFMPGKPDPAFVFRVPRARAQQSRPGVMKLPLIQGALPAGETFTVRIQTVMRSRASAWSPPSEAFTVSSAEAVPGANALPAEPPGGRARGRAGTRSAAADLDRDPALRARLSKLFPDQDMAKAAVGFRAVPDLVAALHVAANLKIPFAEIKRLTAEAGNRNLQKAIAQLRPDVDPRAEAQRAHRQTRQALAASQKDK
jgi:hypothetical protein